MSGASHPSRARSGPRAKQTGVSAVEFALLAVVFFTFVFGVLELARAVYLINTLQEVTRRAAEMAASSDFSTTAQNNVRAQALFANDSGNLILGDPVSPAHLKIEYLSLSRDSGGALSLQTISAGAMPSCPARNRLNCLADPYSSSCIRFVRVQVCQPDGASGCNPVQYKTAFPLIDIPLDLPRSLTVVPVESLGYTVGSMPCS